ETDKATMELESSGDGVLAKLLVPDGTEQIKVGDVIAVLTQEGEELSAAPAPAARNAPIAAGPSVSRSEIVVPVASAARVDKRRIKASPLARRLARAQRIDLSTIQGSGPGGRIVKQDIDKVAAQSSATTSAPTLQPASVYGPPAGVPYEAVKLSTMRKVI